MLTSLSTVTGTRNSRRTRLLSATLVQPRRFAASMTTPRSTSVIPGAPMPMPISGPWGAEPASSRRHASQMRATTRAGDGGPVGSSTRASTRPSRSPSA